MSKVKVTFENLTKLCIAVLKDKYQLHRCYMWTLLGGYKDFFTVGKMKEKEQRSIKYWSSQNEAEVIEKADELFKERKFLDVYELLNRIRFRDNVEVRWRIARSLYHLAKSMEVGKQIKDEMLKEGYEILKQCADVADQNPNYHKWSAILLNESASDLKTKIQAYSQVLRHLEAASELNPEDFATNYLLGRFHYDINSLTAAQKLLASYVFEKPPQVMLEKAYHHLRKAEQIQPGRYLPNLYLLGKTCMYLGQYHRAKYYFVLVAYLPSKTNEEKVFAKDAKKMLKKLAKFVLPKEVLLGKEPELT